MITTITLRGRLGRKHNKVWRLDVNTPREAVDAIDKLKRGQFRRDILDMHAADFRFYVGVGAKEKCIQPLELDMPHNGQPIELRPVARGSALDSLKGWGELILGIVLIAVGVFVPGAGFLVLPGIGLALGGISQLIAPAPGADNLANVKNRPSYQFGGPVNVALQGAPLPLAYGKIWAGSVVGSSSIHTDDRKHGSNKKGTVHDPDDE